MARPVIAMFDDFFPNPEAAFESVSGGEFSDYASAWDGVVYPGINQNIEKSVHDFVARRLSEITDRNVLITAMFARTMLQGIKAPHKIHSDQIMGAYSMHIYLSKDWPSESGTSFWSHKTEGNRQTDSTNCEVINRDHDKFENWTRNIIMLGRFNRAVLHDASLFHCAEPTCGWGDSPKNGRLVLTTFFSEAQ